MLVASVIWIAVFKCGVRIDYFHAKKTSQKTKSHKKDEQNRQGTIKRNEEKKNANLVDQINWQRRCLKERKK